MAGLSLSTSTVINYGFPIPDTVYWLCLERPKPDVPYYLYLDQTSKSASTPYFEGAHVEGSVCLALWDLYDAIDDGDYYVGPDIWGHNDDYNAGAWWQDWDPIIDVFCNFDPQADNPDHDFCWTIYEFIHGWRNLGYPIDSTFINIFEAHNVPVFLPGDADDGGTINILDVGYITAYLYRNGPPPDHMSAADANADCTINILDVDYLIDYLYVSGPEPLVGCYKYYPS
jgi:hypothetical protein